MNKVFLVNAFGDGTFNLDAEDVNTILSAGMKAMGDNGLFKKYGINVDAFYVEEITHVLKDAEVI